MPNLIPKKTKYRFPHSTSWEGKAKGHKSLNQGEHGLQACQGAYIDHRQIEAFRKVISPFIKKSKGEGKMWINIFPHLAKTKKPLEVRMGSGKGSIDTWVAVVKSGTIIAELSGLEKELARKVLKAAVHKLPIKCKIISKDEENEAKK